MAKRCPSCGYAPIGPFIDNCPICAEPVRNVRGSISRSGGGGEGMSPVLKWLLIGGVASVVAVAGCCGVVVWRMGGAVQDMQKEMARAQAEREADQQARTVVVSAADLLREFKEDEKAADEKYFGKYLALTGVVERAAGGRRGSPYVVLHAGDEAAKVKIECHFDYLMPADEARFRRLRPGQTVTIRGEYQGPDGKGGPVQVEQCLLVDTPPAAGPPAKAPEGKADDD